MRRINIFFCLLFIPLCFLLQGCESDQQKSEIVQSAESLEKLKLKLVRMDLRLRESAQKPETRTPEYLEKAYYADSLFWSEYLFGGEVANVKPYLGKVLAQFCQDSKARELMDSVAVHFPPDYPFYDRLEPAMRRLKLAFPEEKTPTFYFYVTGYAPQTGLKEQSYLSDKFCGISLDYFMGRDFPFYPGDLPRYMRRKCDPDYLPIAVLTHFAEYLIPEPPLKNNPTLLDFSICFGLRQHLLQQLLPEVPDSIRLNWTAEQWGFGNLFEKKIYEELVPVLYSRDYLKYEKYIQEKPFTPNVSQKSPDRMGWFMGWKIVQAYAEKHPEISLKQLIQQSNAKTIFEGAKYRPK